MAPHHQSKHRLRSEMLALLCRGGGGARKASLVFPACTAAGGACRRASSAQEVEEAYPEQDLYAALGVKPSATRCAALAAAAACRCRLPLPPPSASSQSVYLKPTRCSAAHRDELKRAFRAKARLLHPDASQGCSDHAAFVRLVHAYQV